jgi:hypothetical protein
MPVLPASAYDANSGSGIALGAARVYAGISTWMLR